MNFAENVFKEQELLFQLAWRYFSIKLGFSAEEMNIIHIKTVTDLTGMYGQCIGTYINNELTKINIEIKTQANAGIIDVMAHEMVHAKQHLRGEFLIQSRPIWKWGFWPSSQDIRIHSGQILEDTPYFEQKCEQEAFDASRELVRQFLNFVHQLEYHVDFIPKS